MALIEMSAPLLINFIGFRKHDFKLMIKRWKPNYYLKSVFEKINMGRLFPFIFLFIFNLRVYGLPDCPHGDSQYWDDCRAEYSYSNGDFYQGEWKDNKIHGSGIYIYSNGDKYEGSFINAMKHGQGKISFGLQSQWAGDEYTGEFRNDKFHGQGVYTYSSGGKYVGEFYNNKKHGQGKITYADGKSAQGIWEDDKLIKD